VSLRQHELGGATGFYCESLKVALATDFNLTQNSGLNAVGKRFLENAMFFHDFGLGIP